MQEVLMKGYENGVWNIALFGDIDLGNAEAFYQEIATAYEQKPGDILFDCEKLEFIDSTTLGTFVKILKKVKQDGYKMSLTHLQPKIKKLFLICSLDTIIQLD